MIDINEPNKCNEFTQLFPPLYHHHTMLRIYRHSYTMINCYIMVYPPPYQNTILKSSSYHFPTVFFYNWMGLHRDPWLLPVVTSRTAGSHAPGHWTWWPRPWWSLRGSSSRRGVTMGRWLPNGGWWIYGELMVNWLWVYTIITKIW